MGLRQLFRGRSDRKVDLQRDLGDIEVPSFPTAVTQVLALLRKPDATSTEIGDVVELDPGLHVRVLRTVNSAAYGLSSEVSCVQKAVTLLGHSRLEALVLSAAVPDALPRSPASTFDQDAFWVTAARRACVARALAHRLHRQLEGECFTAGLLQDIGVPVLVASKGQEYCDLYDRWRSDPALELSTLEHERFGFDHQSVGAALAEKWELPEYLTQAIACHHEPEAEDLAAAVRLVALLRDAKDGPGTEPVLAVCADSTGLAAEEVLQIIEDATSRAEELARTLA